jgi:hypothetical protein
MAAQEEPLPEINVPKLIFLLKQTKLIPQKDISVFKMIIKKMNKGQNLSVKHRQIYSDIVTKLSVDPMSNSMPILALTRTFLKKKAGDKKEK